MHFTPTTLRSVFQWTHLLQYSNSDIEVMMLESARSVHGGEGRGDLTHVLVRVAAVVQVVAETGHEEG